MRIRCYVNAFEHFHRCLQPPGFVENPYVFYRYWAVRWFPAACGNVCGQCGQLRSYPQLSTGYVTAPLPGNSGEIVAAGWLLSPFRGSRMVVGTAPLRQTL